ncbi:MAG: hypothetical protein K2J08_10615 [Ruminococcus sp.]|nr:hypothetical protein [Ruminococcus sp.]
MIYIKTFADTIKSVLVVGVVVLTVVSSSMRLMKIQVVGGEKSDIATEEDQTL